MCRFGSFKNVNRSHQNKPRGAREFFCSEPAKIMAATSQRPDEFCHFVCHIPHARTDVCRTVVASRPTPAAVGSFTSIIPLRPTDVFKPADTIRPSQSGNFTIKRTSPHGQTTIFEIKTMTQPGRTAIFKIKIGILPGVNETFSLTRLALVKQNQHFRQNQSANVKKCRNIRFYSQTANS
jgi:hypothetical protein